MISSKVMTELDQSLEIYVKCMCRFLQLLGIFHYKNPFNFIGNLTTFYIHVLLVCNNQNKKCNFQNIFGFLVQFSQGSACVVPR